MSSLRGRTGLLVAAFLSLTMAQPVAAQDADAPPISAASWTGVYAGGQFGFASGSSDWTHQSINPYSTTSPADPITVGQEAFSPDGVFAGGQIGANYQVSQWVFGAEVSFTSLGLDEARPVSPGAFQDPATTTIRTEIRGLFTTTARLGYAWDDTWLAYVKGGYARANVSTSGVDQSGLDYSFQTREASHGWTLGAGLELRLSDHISLAIEYNHIDLGRSSHLGDIAALPTFPVQMSVDTQFDSVAAHLNLRFGN